MMVGLIERAMALFNAEPLERARALLRALFDRLAFVVESGAVALAIAGFLTFAACQFDWQTVTHEWGNFWTHYADATPDARAGVNVFMAVAMFVLTVLAAAVRYPKASRAFDPIRLGAPKALRVQRQNIPEVTS